MFSSARPLLGGTRRRGAVAAALLGLVTTTLTVGLGFTTAPAQANLAGTDLVISEVYGGGGNSGANLNADFVELYNPTAGAISIAGLTLQYRSSGGSGAANGTALLSGSVPAGKHFLIATSPLSDPDGAALPTPDLVVTGIGMAAGAGTIYLSTSATALTLPTGSITGNAQVIDLVGFGGTNTFETAPTPAISVTTSARRTADDSDTNFGDFTVGAQTPENTSSGGGPSPLAATDPGDKVGTVGVPISPITLTATGGTPTYSWEFTGLPDGITETSDGVLGGAPTAAGTSTVTATVTDSATPAAGTATAEFTITVSPAPYDATIAEIQGTGPATPIPNDIVTTQGVVTGSYPSGDGNLAGFFLQTGGPDTTPGASDGIFVFMGFKTSPLVGTSVEVTGKVSEFFDMTELTPATAGDVTTLPSPLPAVVLGDNLPGTDCTLAGDDCPTTDELEAAREEHEGEAFLPTGDYTVTDAYDGTPFTQASNRGFQMQGEFGLAANSTEPLMIPTELYDQTDSANIAARRAYNAAHAVVLDDGADIDYTSSAVEDVTEFPWLTATHSVRVGADVTFVKPVILEWRRDLWRVQPETKVAGGSTGSGLVQFEQDRPAAPDDVLGDLKIATFNMLNYFNTTGEAWADADGAGGARTCSYYTDRQTPGNRVTNNQCEQDAVDPITGLDILLPGPRGAAQKCNCADLTDPLADFERQEAKELEAINIMDADIVSLEEVENSIKLYDASIDGPGGPDANRDDALIRLVDQLNAHWLADHPGEPNRWAFAPSPRPEAQPTIAEQDAIRSAFIYDPSKVELVGRSRILVNSPAMRNAREPLAQAFKPLGGGRADAFGVIVNHFKSKGGPTAPATVNGDNEDSGDGAGFYNGDRKRQAVALVSFADQFAADKNIDPMFLTGDYNAYAMEDPVQVITSAGYHDLHPTDGEKSYNFGGLAGSLDHVFANEAAYDMVTGVDVWSTNANESVYYEYSRYNSNLANLYVPNQFRASDHNPEIIGIDTGGITPDPDVDTVQILATNDFHGRILDNPGDASAGAAALAGAVKELRADNPDTVFAAAGDLIGASTFESFIANDKPTIDSLNEAGLEVSAAGNHEFDKGYHDLVDRVMAPYDATTNPYGGAAWQYIAANVIFKNTENGHTEGGAALPKTWCKTLDTGPVDGITVGFVGAVTEDLPALVAAGGISELEITDIVDSVNTAADQLKTPTGCGADGPADLVVELVHEGAATTAYSSVTDGSTFGHIVAGADANIDAIVSGHTHLAYNHKVPVAAWAGRDVTERPVVSAGQYGANLNRLEFEFEPGTDNLVNIRQTILALKDYDADPDTQAIVDAAVAYANVAGSVTLGDLEGPFQRARRTDPVAHLPGENRGGESTLGNLIAEIQRWMTGAQIGFMNPGGLRADLNGTGTGSPRPLSYRDAANAQPFANTLETMELTGAEIKVILEQQWQRDAEGNIPSRPFLRLGTSDGFTSTFDETRAEGDRITGMWLNGTKLDPSATYLVSATSFLASGTGDNFWGFAAANSVQDTGKTDLEAVVDYMGEFAEHAVDPPLPVDYRQHQVGVKVTSPDTAPYEAGETVTFTVSSLAMTGADDVQDGQVEVLLDGSQLGTGAVSNTLVEDPPDDSAGKATVTFVVPPGVPDNAVFTLHGLTTDTSIKVPVDTSDGLVNSTVSGQDQSITYGQPVSVPVTVTPSDATGTVTLKDGSTVLGSTPVTGGTGSIALASGSLPVGQHLLTLVYSGDGTYGGATGTVTVTVREQVPTPQPTSITATAAPMTYGTAGAVSAMVTPAAATGTVTVKNGGTTLGTATLSGGSASVSIPGTALEPGTYTLAVSYAGDATHEPSSTTVTLVVNKRGSTTTATAAPMTYGTAGSVNATVSPAAATGTVTVSNGAQTLGTAALSGGEALILIDGTALEPGSHTLTVSYGGDAHHAASSTTVTLVVTKAASTTAATAAPPTVVVDQDETTVSVVVNSTGGVPTGAVQAYVDGSVVASGTLSAGQATLQVGPFDTVGTETITVKYLGDSHVAASQDDASVEVVSDKLEPRIKAFHFPAKVIVDETRATLTVKVKADGVTPTGSVRVRIPGHGSRLVRLEDGKLKLLLPKFGSKGEKELVITYLGNAKVASGRITHVVTVTKR